jgi:hypothetical protein
MVVCGKLYFGVIVIVYCSITKIHQQPIVWAKEYINVVHEQIAQFNIQQGGKLTQPFQKPPIRLKMRIGEIEIEIECQEDQLQSAVDRILSTVTEKLKQAPLSITERAAAPPRAETCKGVIQKLWEEGWFAMPKTLSEVHSEMAKRGFHYDRTAVAHALIDLVKEGILTRDGKPRRYQYAQKIPPP